MRLFKTNAFGQWVFLKVWVIRFFGFVSYSRFKRKYNIVAKGTEKIRSFHPNNVLFVSNHQTYFADVALMYHVIESTLCGSADTISWKGFFYVPKSNLYYVAAQETMKSGFLPRLFRLGGAITVKRTWRDKGQDVARPVDLKDTSNIHKALSDGWVITFPQGTTTPFVKGRKGTAHIILEERPVVVPIVIDGFRRAFDKKGLRIKKKGTDLKITFKEPLHLSYEESVDEVIDMIMDRIEQSEGYNLVLE